MDDSEVNRTKARLMFTPRGWATMSPGCLITPSQCLDRLESFEAAADRGAHAPQRGPSPLRGPIFRRLLARFGLTSQRRQPASM